MKKNIFNNFCYFGCDLVFVILLAIFFTLINRVNIHTLESPIQVLNSIFASVSTTFQNRYTVMAWLWRFSPVISLYLLIRIIKLNSLIALLISFSTFSALNVINMRKVGLIDSPIAFSDLLEFTNFSIAVKYIKFYELLALLGFIILLVLCYKLGKIIERKISTQSKFYSITLILFFIISIFFSLFPFLNQNFPENVTVEKIQKFHDKLGMRYVSWDWHQNIRVNGLPYHLVQTSLRKELPKSNKEEQVRFAGLLNTIQALPSTESPRNIIFILCESCWYNEDLFKESFAPLLSLGFKETRGVSPVYGGGTANSEFEVLTGLPSQSELLSGVLYQEYAVSFRDNSLTFPHYLKKFGYQTYAAHNNNKSFYNRNNVFEKFGFMRYDGIEDMAPLPQDLARQRKEWQWQYDDWALYNQATHYIKQENKKKNFLHLLTMSTHGPYLSIDGDNGEQSYIFQINEAVRRLSEFVKQLESIDPNALIVVYGDHKPSLTKYFYENGVFSEDNFEEIGESNAEFKFNEDAETKKIIGDIPILIKSGNKIHTDKLIKQMNGKPLFCLPILVDDVVTKINVPIVAYSKSTCKNLNANFDYPKLTESYGGWLYANTLF